ncbi:unnamed protein product, partial [Rodentolepis nana]|uniref:Uncharacterized protein n=1 Tax=Rodentolepis nana TaxID=102285 RepID=A0A0R3TGK3_RODNA
MSSSRSPSQISPTPAQPNAKAQLLPANTNKSPCDLTSPLSHLSSPHSPPQSPSTSTSTSTALSTLAPSRSFPTLPSTHSLHLHAIYQQSLSTNDDENAQNSNDSIATSPAPPPCPLLSPTSPPILISTRMPPPSHTSPPLSFHTSNSTTHSQISQSAHNTQHTSVPHGDASLLSITETTTT